MICYVIGGKGQRKEGKFLKNSFYMPAALLEMKAAYGKSEEASSPQTTPQTAMDGVMG